MHLNQKYDLYNNLMNSKKESSGGLLSSFFLGSTIDSERKSVLSSKLTSQFLNYKKTAKQIKDNMLNSYEFGEYIQFNLFLTSP